MFTKKMNYAFTLIELMMVIIVISIALTIVAINLDTIIPSERIRAEAKAVGNIMGLARAEAAMKGVNYGIVYDLKNNAFWLLVPEIEGNEAEDYFETDSDDDSQPEVRRKLMYHKMPDEIEIKDVEIGEESTITDDLVKIEVTPLGIASGHIVHLQEARANKDNTRAEFSIELNPLTGIVTYYDYYKEFEEVEDYEE